ncbi:MAG: redoxin domain-containing protein, partial [Anaeroplasmataceae bacterium]|nr:redoxin domain-containing protein [Anaeroplasmataceae bacterium]
ATTTQQVEKGQKLTGVAEPTRDGYTFTGWKVNGEAWTMETAVTADIKIVAQWEEDAVIDNRLQYVVTVKGVSGKPLSGFIVYFTNPLDSSFNVTPKMTDGKGEAKFSLDPDNYLVRIEAENGWYFDEDETSYVTTVTKDSRNVSVECFSKLIEDENPGLVTAGSPAYDFTVKTVDGKEWNLKEQLETYDLVVLNFWYTTCTYCLLEFPYLNDAWNDYQDKVALIGLNNGSDDTTQDVIGFQESQGLDFPLALDSSNVAHSYVTMGYPTTVFIDRYGTADYIESGAITSKDKWTKLFDSYLGEDYVPTYKGSATDEEEREIPDVEMSNPDDIAKLVNSEGFNGVFGNYVNEKDDKWNWPWIIDEESESIIPSNSFKNNSFSIFTLTTSMEKNQVLSFDYRCAVDDSDILYILSDNRIITELTGYYKDYKTHHLFVAPRDGEYTFSFCYMKDGILSDNIDKIFLKNFRFSTLKDITEFTYMLRDCSYGELLFDSYEYYEKVVFNQKDGYYHVGTETGPLVFADLFNQTHFSSTPILTYFSDEEFLTNDADGKKVAQYKDIISEYGSYANDSVVGGYVPVTEDLAQALKAIAEVLGVARGNDDAWLEMCVYFNVYGPTDGIDYIDPVTKEIVNPIKGLA